MGCAIWGPLVLVGVVPVLLVLVIGGLVQLFLGVRIFEFAKGIVCHF
jgi:hypothetical protein